MGLVMVVVSRRRALGGLAAGLGTVALAGCQMAPGTGRDEFNLLSPSDEAKMGRDSHPEILAQFGGAVDDPALSAYVAGIGQRLVGVTETPAADFRFTVLNSDIVNAMALPGGYVYVTRGLLSLCGNEAELAGVIGHEIGHVLGRHSAQRYSRAMAANVLTAVLGMAVGSSAVSDVAQLGAGAWLQSYSRENELEADHLGLRYLRRGGWDAQAMVSMLNRLRDHGRLEMLMAGRNPDEIDQTHFMATHPRTVDRVQAAVAEVEGGSGGGSLGSETYLARIDGMVYGDDPAEGVVRGTAFIHPGLGLRFDVPPGFRLTNGAKAVVANDGQGAAVIFDAGKPAGGDMLSYIGRVWMPRARLANGETLTINGLAAATATTQGRTSKGAVDIRLVAIRFDADSVFRFTFVTPPNRTAALGEGFRRTTYSFRTLSAAERAEVKPLRLRIHTVKAGESARSLAATQDVSDWQSERFQTLNNLAEGEALRPGQRVKLIRY